MKVAEQILKGNPRAIARGISLVENDGLEAQNLLKVLFPHTGKSTIIGITGAPGSGKSTLVDKLISCIREDDRDLGIIAVDPSSPFSGGAILGDRIRMMRHSMDPRIFIRSMATRGHLGGLAKASGEAISVLEASGKGTIIVETVGVGQDEVEVVKFADIILVVLIPGVGDEIQAFKAGLMEIADIFVLNKADSPDTEKTEKQLKAMLELGLKEKPIPTVIKTIATENEGIQALYEEMERLLSTRDNQLRASRKKKLISLMLRDIISEKLYKAVSDEISDVELEEVVARIHRRELDPYSAADEIIGRSKRY